ncbi:MAG: fructose 1,6-bisphosphatase [Bacillota bacterium]
MPCYTSGTCRALFWGPKPPRVVALGFQLANGKLIGPQDFFADPSYDEARRKANLLADYMRSLGLFESNRLPLDEMEYTTLPEVMEKRNCSGVRSQNERTGENILGKG